MAMSRSKFSLPENPELNSLASQSAFREKVPAPGFVMFRLKDSDKAMGNISPFYIQQALGSIAEKVTNASLLKIGTLRAEARNKEQASVLLKATLHGSHPVHLKRHTTLKLLPGSHSH
jgi:hypothetical protein